MVPADSCARTGTTVTATQYPVSLRNQEGVYELILPDAFDNLMSFQYIDNAGNITAKTLKGALLRAIEVSIRTSFISLQGETQIVVEIGDFMNLESPYLTIDFGDDSDPLVIDFGDPAQSALYTLLPDEPEEGKIYTARVVNIRDFGIFVAMEGVKKKMEGLVHISQITQERVENVSDHLSEGQEVKVKVLDVDQRGRIKLSMKEVDDGADEGEESADEAEVVAE